MILHIKIITKEEEKENTIQKKWGTDRLAGGYERME